MKHFEPRAAFAMLFFTASLWDSCSAGILQCGRDCTEAEGQAAAEVISNVSTSSMPTTEYEPPCLNVNYCTQAAVCCPTGMDDYGWIAAAVGWSLWFLTLILLCMDKIMKLRPDEPKYLVA